MNEDSPLLVFLAVFFSLGTLLATLAGVGGSAYNYGKIDATNLTTIECVKEPKKCKVRYDYLMMREN